MLHFLGIIFIIIIAILLIGLSIIGSILRGLFGIGRRKYTFHNTNKPFADGSYSTGDNRQNQSPASDDTIRREEGTSHPTNRKKIFTKEDGEYVDFEEIKE